MIEREKKDKRIFLKLAQQVTKSVFGQNEVTNSLNN